MVGNHFQYYSYDGLGNRVEKVEKTTIESSKNSSYTSIVKEDGKYNEEYDQELVSQRTNEQIDNLSKTISDHLKNYNQLCKGFSKDEKKSSIKTIKYVNDINQEYTQVLQTSNDAGEMIERYTYGIERIDEVRQKEEASYYAYDGLGNVIGKETTKKPNEISFKVSYDDFGKPNKKMDDEYGYNSEAHDYNNSQYLRARYYDSKSGVFNQEDSYLGRVKKPITQNRYAYSHNNPINLEDPSGHYIAFDDADDDAISRVINANQQVGNKVTWEEAEKTYFTNKPDQQAAYTKKQEESAKKAEAYNAEQKRKAEEKAKLENQRYVDDVDDWFGDSGKIGKRLFWDLIGQGMSYANAYQYAFSIKKYCDDNLAKWQIEDVYEKISKMQTGNGDITNYFFQIKDRTWVEGYGYGNTGKVHNDTYTEFLAYLAANPTAQQFGAAVEAAINITIILGTGLYALFQMGGQLPVSALGPMSYEDALAYERWWNQVEAGWTAEQIYNFQLYQNIDGKTWTGDLNPGVVNQNLNAFTNKQVNDLSNTATHNANSDVAVLGKWSDGNDSYIKVAENKNATYFDLGDKGWNNASSMVNGNEAEMWKVNQKFLDTQISQGKNFILSHDPNINSPFYNGFYRQEIDYIIKNGYTIIKQGEYWYAFK